MNRSKHLRAERKGSSAAEKNRLIRLRNPNILEEGAYFPEG